MKTRRDVLKTAAAVAASAAMAPVLAADAKSKTLLILGGTGFIGPHLTEEAKRLGWKVTHFNRGKRDADGVPGVETLLGDRKGQLDSLKGRKWDAVVDNTGYIPKFVKQSAELLAPNCGYCLFVSSISAYASFAKPNDESSPTGKLADINIEEVTNDSYGPMKALCEQYSMDAFKGRASVVRPGYIVGPLDSYGSLHVLAGARVERRRDARARHAEGPDPDHRRARSHRVDDEARRGAHHRSTSTRVARRAHFTLGDIITASEKESPKAGTKVTWVREDFLVKQWKPEEVDVPPWSPMKGDYAAASLTSAAPR